MTKQAKMTSTQKANALGDSASRVTSKLDRKKAVVSILKSRGSKRAERAYNELVAASPHELNEYDISAPDFGEKLVALFRKSKVPMTDEYAEKMQQHKTASKDDKSERATADVPAMALDPADWNVPVCEFLEEGKNGVAYVPRCEIQHWLGRAQDSATAAVIVGEMPRFDGSQTLQHKTCNLPVLWLEPGSKTPKKLFKSATLVQLGKKEVICKNNPVSVNVPAEVSNITQVQIRLFECMDLQGTFKLLFDKQFSGSAPMSGIRRQGGQEKSLTGWAASDPRRKRTAEHQQLDDDLKDAAEKMLKRLVPLSCIRPSVA